MPELLTMLQTDRKTPSNCPISKFIYPNLLSSFKKPIIILSSSFRNFLDYPFDGLFDIGKYN